RGGKQWGWCRGRGLNPHGPCGPGGVYPFRHPGGKSGISANETGSECFHVPRFDGANDTPVVRLASCRRMNQWRMPAMATYLHFWVGHFYSGDLFGNYLEENEEADAESIPLNKFCRDQKEMWIDHDCMEMSMEEES